MKEVELDCKNLNCPMPIVKISRAIKGIEIGDRLVVSATDPAFKADVEAWIRKTGHTLVSFKKASGSMLIATIEKADE
jgi:TusA-related sulfurtransferase